MNGYMSKRVGAVLAATFCAATAVTTVAAPVASAHHLTGPGICGGSEYQFKGTASVRTAGGTALGRVVISRHQSSDTVCAVTLKENHSTSSLMSVKIKRSNQDNWARVDSGNFSQYAGPVYLGEDGWWIEVRGEIAGRWTEIDWNGYYEVCIFRQEGVSGQRYC